MSPLARDVGARPPARDQGWSAYGWPMWDDRGRKRVGWGGGVVMRTSLPNGCSLNSLALDDSRSSMNFSIKRGE